MAEQLGTAVLRLEVDSSALREGLAEAKRLVQGTNIQIGTKGGGGSGGGGGRARSGGARENTRALEIAQERRFRLSQRIEALEQRGANVSRLRRRLGDLTEAQSRRQFGTFRQISQELARQVSLAERKQVTAEREARAQRQLAAIGSRQGGARESVTALFDAQRRRYRLDQQIRSLEASGVNSAKLRQQLGEATEAQARRNFGSAKQISDQLAFQLQKERDKLKVRQQEQRLVERQARIGGPRSPLRGGANIAGSPAFLQAQQRAEQIQLTRAARQGGARSPVRGDRNTPGSPAFIEAQAKEYQRAISRAAAIGGASSPLRGSASIPGSPAFIEAEAAKARRQAAAREAAIQRSARIGGPRSPIGGSLNLPGSPAFLSAQRSLDQQALNRSARLGGPSLPISGRLLNGGAVAGSPAAIQDAIRAEAKLAAERSRAAKATDKAAADSARRRKDAVGSAIIGGAFPLLFGQGLGASIGGAAGGGLGGAIGGQFGFGLSLVGTAFGAQIDLALQKLQSLSGALSDPIAKFSEIQEAGLLSSKGLERNIEALIATGRGAEAAALIQADLGRIIGDTSGAKALAEATDSLNRAWAEATVATANFVAGPLAGLIRGLSAGINAGNAAGQVRSRRSQLTPEQNAQIRSFRSNRADQLGLPAFTTDIEAYQLNLDTLKEIDRITGVTARNEKQLSAARNLYNRSLSTSFRLIDAQTQGYERQTLELQKQQALDQRDLELGALSAADRAGPKGQQLQQEAARRVYEINQQIAELDQKRWAEAIASANRIKDIQGQAAVESRRVNLTGTGVQVLQAQEQLKAAIRAEQSAQAALRARPGDTGLQNAAAEAAETTRQVAAKTRTDLIEGFRAARREAENAANALQDAYTNLLSLRTGNQGLNQYLSGADRALREEQTFRQLQPLFEQAKQTARGILAPSGIRGFDVNFSGSTASVNQDILRFINSVNQEQRAGQTLGRAGEDAVLANNSLVVATNALAKNNILLNDTLVRTISAVDALAQKAWEVNVNVPGGSVTGDVVGAVNSRL